MSPHNGSNNSNNGTENNEYTISVPNTVGSTAATALSLLLREDPLLISHNLVSATSATAKSPNEEAAFSYAAALLRQDQEDAAGRMSASSDFQRRASEALAEVDRKLALIDKLAERISREKPEDVAGPLLRLHGYSVGKGCAADFRQTKDDTGRDDTDDEEGAATQDSGTATLLAIRDRCDRLRRQGEVLEGVAERVEGTLSRGLKRMEHATEKLERVLQINAVLKMAMRLRFESKKVLGSGLDFNALASNGGNSPVDLRDLTRTAASVAVMEDLLSHSDFSKDNPVDVVENMRSDAKRVATAVRRAAAGLLAEQHQGSGMSAMKLGATLQVYYCLGELPEAAWGTVSLGLERAEKASGQFFNPSVIQTLLESARTEAKLMADTDEKAIGSSSTVSLVDKRSKKKQAEAAYDRALKKKLREKKAESASKWAAGISDCALQVWNLCRVLARKSDAVTRQNFLEVVNSASVPEKFHQAEQLLAASRIGSKDKEMDLKSKNSIFALFWNQMCLALGQRIQKLLKYDNGSIAKDVASLYPAVRAAALDMLSGIHDIMQVGNSASSVAGVVDDMNLTSSSGSVPLLTGIMGGSAGLDNTVFFGWTEGNAVSSVSHMDELDAETSGFGAVSADSWTKSETLSGTDGGAEGLVNSRSGNTQTSSALSSIFSSPEWIAFQGNSNSGLRPLQRAFLEGSNERLSAPLEFMFQEAVSVDENGVALPVLPSLPTRNDLRKIETIIRDELSIADPREGGGELSMTTMISENVVNMIEKFCASARGATSETGEGYYLHDDGTATEGLMHDLKVAGVMSAMATILRNVPESTFIVPYRPAQSPQHEEAASMCQISLLPALHVIEGLVKSVILSPLCLALNKRILHAIAMLHRGLYLEDSVDGKGEGSFVQDRLVKVYENISNNQLSQLPPEYARTVAATVAGYSVYSFVSNATLVRPLGEMGRLRITQDLANFEMALEQLMFKGGSSTTLSQVAGGRPYAELRAVRHMLFWSGLENKNATPTDVAKNLLREVWIKDVRPSSVFHFLCSFAPKLLSSPHHFKRVSAEQYVDMLVKRDGSIDDGEASAWMTTMACCDAYQQRESVDTGDTGSGDGDRRIATILMIIGPELLRRRRQ